MLKQSTIAGIRQPLPDFDMPDSGTSRNSATSDHRHRIPTILCQILAKLAGIMLERPGWPRSGRLPATLKIIFLNNPNL
jgi:hypothetical protein